MVVPSRNRSITLGSMYEALRRVAQVLGDLLHDRRDGPPPGRGVLQLEVLACKQSEDRRLPRAEVIGREVVPLAVPWR